MTAHRMYLFKGFERFWHWAQAALIIALLVTGFQIHGYLHWFDFSTAVQVHGYLAWALVTLWIFAIFWHFTTGEWKQYTPTFDKIDKMILYYIWGIFFKQRYPHHQWIRHKHNPLQRLAYLWLKLMVHPLVWVSGALLLLYSYDWLPHMPLGLAVNEVAWAHTAAAYMLLFFLIAHLYLITTGKTPLTYTKAMITGWEVARDEVEPESVASKTGA
ncbi:cytochrome b/b6 domain-containing protein [Rhodopila globiformis]|uniref:Cytochrome B n=1 Tax=Rhodopila globiformis TaxID=1071 RepID=A0A2S6NIA6_RHOGL|nr:cytochrome b/b6 domain-containing protein [Rhodopila globiformis]PPQ34352.1 cytochrome B [Rhodopila globiformis]